MRSRNFFKLVRIFPRLSSDWWHEKIFPTFFATAQMLIENLFPRSAKCHHQSNVFLVGSLKIFHQTMKRNSLWTRLTPSIFPRTWHRVTCCNKFSVVWKIISHDQSKHKCRKPFPNVDNFFGYRREIGKRFHFTWSVWHFSFQVDSKKWRKETCSDAGSLDLGKYSAVVKLFPPTKLIVNR